MYHAAMTEENKDQVTKDFCIVNSNIRLLFTTSAFSMGMCVNKHISTKKICFKANIA